MTAIPSTPTSPRTPLPLFATTIALGAFLLFQVQPLIAKYILPWFGGAAAVWTTCMLFFQLLLLAGYAYAHALLRLPPRAQILLHILLLIAAAATLPIVPADHWKPTGPGDPTFRILALLATTVGLPYLLVASTGPLLQAWLARGPSATSPYRLYALSNIASLAALLTYPFVIEPLLTRHQQAITWSTAFAIFALLSAFTTLNAPRLPPEPRTLNPEPSASPLHKLLWLLLPACGTLLLLATTNRICQEVAVIPFLWIVPLSIYLLTFVIAFDSPRWYHRGVFMSLLPLAIAGVTVLLFAEFAEDAGLAFQLTSYCLALFVTCTICHGELARLKPPPSHLTGFYLTLSAGGALGGAFVALAAPLLFRTYFEFPLSLIVTSILAGAILFTDKTSRLYNGRPSWAWLSLMTLFMLLGYALIAGHNGEPGRVVARSRSFYGTLSVVAREEDRPQLANLLLRHGGITHGLQLTYPDRRNEPTTYYGRTSGVGLLLQNLLPNAPRRIGAVGLGAGTLAVYGRPGDTFRFYEINPGVLDYAQAEFTFLKDSAAKIESVLGDGRLSLEREPDQHFDALVLDAFNGDAIPVHLLTRQAFECYRRHLKPAGVIAIHITNQHLDLRPIVQAAADYLKIKSRFVLDDQNRDKDNPQFPSEWMLLGPDEAFLNSLPVRPFTSVPPKIPPTLWTDDRTSLFPIMR